MTRSAGWTFTDRVTTRHHVFRRAWTFPPDMVPVVARFVAREPRPAVHLFNGSSALGDIHVDVNPGNHFDIVEAADIRADVAHLPFRSNSVPTVLADPPWATNIRARGEWMREIARVLKVGGRLILNAPWVPKASIWDVEEIWVSWPRWGLYMNANLWTICRKVARVGGKSKIEGDIPGGHAPPTNRPPEDRRARRASDLRDGAGGVRGA